MLHEISQRVEPLSSANIIFQFLATQKNVYYLYVKLLFSQLKSKEELPTTPSNGKIRQLGNSKERMQQEG